MTTKGNIGYFVYNLDSYSGSASQALLLAKEFTDYRIFIFNTNYGKRFRRRLIENQLVVFDLPKNVFLRIWFIATKALRLKIRVFHLHAMYLSAANRFHFHRQYYLCLKIQDSLL